MKATLAALLLIPSFAVAQTTPDSGSKVYQNVVRSTAWIISNRPSSVATGSGSLIDAKRHLVLTNYHVVGEVDQVTVVFAVYKDGSPIAERGYYERRKSEIGMRGRVIARDRSHDLALIQLDRTPAGVPALTLAERRVTPGQTIHSIGNPGGSGALWVYTPGKVRQVYHKEWRSEIDGRAVNFSGEVVETDSPTNPGDSGGPLVNDAGELVGVTQGGAVKVQAISNFIGVSEVRRLLNSAEVARIAGPGSVTTSAPPAVVKPSRSSVIASRDGGRFFSDSAFDAAKESAKKVFAKTGKDIVIETYATLPGNRSAEVKAMKPDDRKKFFQDWSRERAKTEGLRGVLLLVSRDPGSYFIEITDDARGRIDADDFKKMQQAIIDRFKEKKYDEGLQEFIKIASDKLGR